jgi:hypothetical protein
MAFSQFHFWAINGDKRKMPAKGMVSENQNLNADISMALQGPLIFCF